MRDYKVGDCLIHLHSGKLFRIYGKFPNAIGILVYTVESINNTPQSLCQKFSMDTNNINDLFVYCPVAQLLYTNNSNKAVTNETNEK